MQRAKLKQFKIAGLSARLSNAQPERIEALWEQFFKADIGNFISSKEGNDIYCVYHSYEGDHLAPFCMTIGYKVPADFSEESDFSVVTIPAQTVAQFEVIGEQPQALIAQWQQIWQSAIDRAYRADFDLYDASRSDRVVIHVGRA